MGFVGAAALYNYPGIRQMVKPFQVWYTGFPEADGTRKKAQVSYTAILIFGLLFLLINQVLNRVKVFLLSRSWHVLLFGTD